jgi:hypothetical protein
MFRSPLFARVSAVPSRSLSAAGESRYSAMRAAEPALEGARIEALRLPALFTFDQCCANRFDLGAPLLVSGSVPVFVRISPGNFSYVRTKSDTVMGFTAEALQRNRRRITRAGRSGSFRYSR